MAILVLGGTGGLVQLAAFSEKEKRVLGWKSEHSRLKTIVVSAWNWHKAHPDGFGA